MLQNSIALIISVLLLKVQLSYAEKPMWRTPDYRTNHNAEVQGCQAVVSYLTFNFGTGKYAVDAAMCGYPPALGTVLLCLSEMFDNDEAKMESAYRRYGTNCASYSNESLTVSYFEAQLKNATENKIDMSDIANVSLPIYQPTTPNMTAADAAYRAYVPFYTNLDEATYFGSGLLIYFGVVMLLSGITKVLKRTGLLQKLSNPLFNVFRSYVTIPATYPKGRHAQPWGGLTVFTGLFPDRMDSLICLGYIVVHIIFWAYPYHTSEAHVLVWESTTKELRKYLADRTGIMAFAEVPLLILFAGRNNFLAFITDFKYSSFVQFHKWVARMMILDAIIHSVCYTWIVRDHYTTSIKTLYFVCGVLATLFAGLIWLFSFHPFRSHFYESFLYIHIAFVIVFIVMCWYHCRELGHLEWIVGACAIWTFDRLVRILRMASFGYHTANIALINNETFKVSLSKPSFFNSEPGQFGYVYFSDSLLWFQNHPFTIVNEGDTIVLYVKIKKGITQKIFKNLVANGGKITRKVCIEGPYGEVVPNEKYDNVLLIAGGAGIPGIFSQALKLCELERPRNAKFILIHKTVSDLQYYYQELLINLKDTRVIIDVYLTRESALDGLALTSTSSDEDESLKKREGSKESLPSFMNFKIGRPNMELMLNSEIENFGGGSVAIDACGPPTMMDQLKHAVSLAVLDYDKRIDYFDEYQIW